MSVLFEHRDEFDDRNAFLQVTLGLVSAARVIERLLPRFEAVPRSPVDTETIEPFQAFLLGIVSVASTIRRHADAAIRSESSPPGEGDSKPPARPSMRSLLEL